jgi:hypothetical protein
MYYPFHNTNMEMPTFVMGSRGSWQGRARAGVSPNGDNAGLDRLMTILQGW